MDDVLIMDSMEEKAPLVHEAHEEIRKIKDFTFDKLKFLDAHRKGEFALKAGELYHKVAEKQRQEEEKNSKK